MSSPYSNPKPKRRQNSEAKSRRDFPSPVRTPLQRANSRWHAEFWPRKGIVDNPTQLRSHGGQTTDQRQKTNPKPDTKPLEQPTHHGAVCYFPPLRLQTLEAAEHGSRAQAPAIIQTTNSPERKSVNYLPTATPTGFGGNPDREQIRTGETRRRTAGQTGKQKTENKTTPNSQPYFGPPNRSYHYHPPATAAVAKEPDLETPRQETPGRLRDQTVPSSPPSTQHGKAPTRERQAKRDRGKREKAAEEREGLGGEEGAENESIRFLFARHKLICSPILFRV
ncbi:hypothetical protein RHMOL_Rhmol07G0170500 [Rhododendron molle]|uniref:Uncharacterized protein n=1 Tax=Rhododendron molle TaxID=49168 RepID=A0ACC0N1X3_RHOML|nr:hypothetical protein RHMOL_Rhmol07G0170500 [Rhododendron molle]